MGVFELMIADSDLRELIHQNAPESALRDAAQAAGMVPMRVDGERLVALGLISEAELVRATRD